MRIVHVSDLHVTEGPRLADQGEMLALIVGSSLAPDLWIISGDLFGRDIRHRSSPLERNVLYPAIVEMAEQAPVVVLYGNHDHEPDLEALACLGGEWPVIVVKGASVQTVNTRAGRVHLYLLAYPTKRWLLAGEDTPPGVEAAQAMVQDKLGALLGLWAGKIRRDRVARPTEPHVFVGHLQVRGCALAGGEVLAGQEIELTRAQLDGLPVDYGALGHLHLNQEVALRCWYAGSPWRNDFGERDSKGYLVVDVSTDGAPAEPVGEVVANYASGERLATLVQRVETPCRRFVTLDWHWGAHHDNGQPRWLLRPSAEAFTYVPDAEVRCRLVVPQQWVAGCPWEAEVERVRAAGALRLQVERKIEVVVRSRVGDDVAAFENVPVSKKVGVYWDTLAAPPLDVEKASALACLEALLSRDDEAIRTDDALLG